jgi:acetyltransferase-like isoleucine patch superfamily enzyme
MSIRLDHDWFTGAVPANVDVGEGTWIYSSFAFLHYRSRQPRGLRIGANCGIYVGTLFDIGPDGTVQIGDRCLVNGAVFSTNGPVVIGDSSMISFDVVLADTETAVPPDGAVLRETRTSNSIEIGENVWIGTRAVVLGGARIGEGSIVGALSVVDFDVPPFSIVAGNPGRVVGSVRSEEEPA